MTIKPVDMKSLTDKEREELFNPIPGPAEEKACPHNIIDQTLGDNWTQCALCHKRNPWF